MRDLPVDRPSRHRHLGRRAQRDGTVRVLAGSALWLSLLLVTYWWDRDGGIRDLTVGGAPGLTSLGRLTGLVASVLLLAQVVLMARVPLLESAYGQDRLARLHRLVGFTSFNLMVAHIVLITGGYAGASFSGTPATLWRLVTTYPGMLMATGGTAALVMVVVTSVKAARRRLRYESWHLLHLYAYLGVGLALPHQLWTGQQFLSSPARTAFWWILWAVAAGAILVFRVGVPVLPQPAPPARRHLGGPRVGRHRLGLPDRTPARPAAGRGRPVPLLPVPGPTGLDPRQPLLPVRRARRSQPADHHPGRRRRQRRDVRAAPGHPGPGRGPLRPARRPRPDPAEGRPHRRRRRHHPDPRPGRGPRRPLRRLRGAAPLHHGPPVRP